MTISAPHKELRRRNGPAKQRRRPPGSSAEDTVARLVEAAQIQFGTHGYSGARMTEIASAAGITHSSIYQDFASKRELYQAAFEAAQAELLPEYLEAIETGATFKEQIKAIFRASARTHERNPTITPFLASIPIELRRHPDLLPTLQVESSRLMTSLSNTFASARKRGEIPKSADDMDLLVGFIGAVMGIGLVSYGIQNGRMSTAVEMLLAAFDGEFFGGLATPATDRTEGPGKTHGYRFWTDSEVGLPQQYRVSAGQPHIGQALQDFSRHDVQRETGHDNPSACSGQLSITYGQ